MAGGKNGGGGNMGGRRKVELSERREGKLSGEHKGGREGKRRGERREGRRKGIGVSREKGRGFCSGFEVSNPSDC